MLEYISVPEVARKWGISERRVQKLCEESRIPGAAKFSRVWLIPKSAEKPFDKRCSLKRQNDNCYMQGEPYSISENEIDNIYRTGDVYNNLGLTRETLRYYEEIGLITPKRSKDSQYREFDLYDMSRLMAIDFFKKRGFTPNEIRGLQGLITPEEYVEAMQKKLSNLSKEIEDLTLRVRHLEKDKNFLSNIIEKPLEFTIKELPAYYIQEAIGSVAAFDEYRDKVLSYLNLEQEDILSNMVRAVTFDENGYKTSAMYIVKPFTHTRGNGHKALLKYGKCLYTTFTAENSDPAVMDKMFDLCHEYGKKHDLSFQGVVYVFVRFVMFHEQADRHCYEIWVPLK